MEKTPYDLNWNAVGPAKSGSRMPLTSGINGHSASTASLLEPKSMMKQLLNSRGKDTGNLMNPVYGSGQRYNPSQLLNPKSFDTRRRHQEEMGDTPSPESTPERAPRPASGTPQFVFTTPGPDEFTPLHYNDGRGMQNMIERNYNISKREDRPMKRQKVEHVEGAFDAHGYEKATFAGGGKGGEIGEYMRHKRREGLEEAGPIASVVDLTGDDDEVQIIANSEDKEVCFGRLEGTKVQAHVVPSPNPKTPVLSKIDWPTMRLQFQRFPGNTFIIRVLDPTGKDFGNVDIRTSQGLAPIMDAKAFKVRIQARLNRRKKKQGDYPGTPCSEYYDMTVNLYGPKRQATAIGKFLSQKQIWLRTPLAVDHGVEICNPHIVKNAVLPRTSAASSGCGVGYVTRTQEEVRNDVLGMFDSLQKSENLPEMEPDNRIVTPLLSHQKQGLFFMTSKEKARVFDDEEECKNNSLWRLHRKPNGQVMYVNVITGREERSMPPEVRGGILADMMGLGKTLSILSLIVGTLDEASEWARLQPTESALVRNSKTTLLVAPLSVVSNWEEQISAHIRPGALKCYIYHGGNRCQNIDALAQYDIIVTTYSIAASEFMGRSKKRDVSPLLRTNFFRIVLDEAHMIREQSTRQFRAITALSAQRRWAVTGTPVQNRLEDLGALIKFLRVKPFDEHGGFTQFILSPFKCADPEILPKLRLLVDSITLRRLKDRIDLPPRHDIISRLPFTQEEGELYEWFAKDSINRMRVIASGERKSLGGKTYVHILQAIMRLRLICAHGKELLREEDLKLTEGLSSTNAIDLDDDEQKPVINSRQAYEMLMLFKETDTDTCSQCMRKIGQRDVNVEEAKDEVIGYMLPCYQMVCKDCISEVRKTIDGTKTDDRFTCPFCTQYLRVAFFELTSEGIESAEEARTQARENPRQAKVLGRYGGPHTKTRRLLECILESKEESKKLPKTEQPIKSVVFSGWTAHLDLIQIALEDNSIKFVRLDGKMARPARSASLEAFRTNAEVTVILVSISAGGLGLNLTSASKVYVMEPQFNPAAEAQAIDRVHRLGQKREVTTTRFIMDGSFEEKMLDLQRKKQNLADLSMNRGKLDKAEATKRRLEELRSLFK